ncbi:Osb1 protein [Thalictrum thalictroides]|uniref:Osb1 protein n=1 Tax=Thalictrum thalictroides TaxID=46969 RepID=A0A7J6WH38_THATH|nr:Osb1 protein [Thalictrum thalictroides]
MALSLRTPSNLISTPQNPNSKSKSLHLLSSSSSLSFPLNLPNSLSIKRLKCHRAVKSSINGYYNNFNGEDNLVSHKEEEQLQYPKPTEIPWNKEICNSVHLIGVVGTPVQVKHLNSGKVLAWTRLAVKKSATETTWINLTFWNELAHVASQHVEKGQRIYVSGRLVSDTVEGDYEKAQTYYKVVVQQLNFIEKSFSPVPLYEQDRNSTPTGGQVGNSPSKNTGSTQELWQAFFANPVDWWDNRKNKKNLKYPDFKHKDTGESLWVDAKYNPPWVKSQLAILDSRMESFHSNEASRSVSYVSSDDLTLF